MNHEQHEQLTDWGFVKNNQFPNLNIYELYQVGLKVVWQMGRQTGYYIMDNEHYHINDWQTLEDLMEQIS